MDNKAIKNRSQKAWAGHANARPLLQALAIQIIIREINVIFLMDCIESVPKSYYEEFIIE
jgi:hypothetical protein